MKSVGEVMSMGRTFKQALGKAMRSLETGKSETATKYDAELIQARLITPNPDRLGYVRFAFDRGYTVEQVHEITAIDPWFLRQVKEMVDLEKDLAGLSLDAVSRETMLRGQAGRHLGYYARPLVEDDAGQVRSRRKEQNVRAVFNRVDTCAAEFESHTRISTRL